MSTPVSSLFDFRGRSVIVTGASKGIGRGIALRFGEAGASVAVFCRNDAGRASEVVAEIVGRGSKAIVVPADLSDSASVARAIQEVLEAFGRIDGLINNAGIYPLVPLLEMTEAAFDETISTDLKSVHLMTQAVARAMIAGGRGGVIINITSIEAFDPAPMHAHYNAAKGGVFMYTRASALELGKHGIRVNAVAPGLIDRPGLDKDWPDGVNRYLATAPLQRLGQPSDIADACLFLASDAALWITGASLTVDGGVTSTQSF
jgi:3-oxoacyl-[acyl-carrier protein] reductase